MMYTFFDLLELVKTKKCRTTMINRPNPRMCGKRTFNKPFTVLEL